MNQVWSYDFVWDQTADGRMLKILPVVDEVSRECFAILVGRSITAADVVALLERLIEEHGAPEFIAEAIQEFVKTRGLETVFISPGSPWENAYIESFNARLRDELLDRELFTSLTEAHVLAEAYGRDFNQHRPHSSLGYLTPSEFRRLQERRSEETREPEAQNRARTNAMDRGVGRRTPEMVVIELS